MCACVHTRACIRAHTRTHTHQGVHRHTCMHTPTHVAPSRGCRGGPAGAQHSTGTPSVEKIMPVVGS